MLYQQQGNLKGDISLPVPDTTTLPLSSSTMLYQQFMPGIAGPYTVNNPQPFTHFEANYNFFQNFPQFGYFVSGVNWFDADGVPMTWVDDQGVMNPYPLMRVQALDSKGTTLAQTDIVLPVSSELTCQQCHVPAYDTSGQPTNISCDPNNPVQPSGVAANYLRPPSLEGVSAWVTPDNAPGATCLNKIQNAMKENVLLRHDRSNGTTLYTSAVVNHQPMACDTCHYSPALDLTQVGPGLVNTGVNNNQPQLPNQLVTRSMSGAIHSAHARVLSGVTDVNQSCYLCHPGQQTQCLRGIMSVSATCFSCHGQVANVGNDFTVNVSATSPANQPGVLDFTKRVPWANEPKCQSCHTGDALNPNHPAGALVADDGIRLLQAYLPSDPNATPISSPTSRFAENPAPKGSTGNNGSILYRLSTGHGGVFCEGCHGSTHAEWPNVKSASANDNLAAIELQGHSGRVIECGACHTGQLMASLGGPHGIHPVGDRSTAGDNIYSAFWIDQHAGYVKSHGSKDCQACHGTQGQGTTLARVAAQRTLRTIPGQMPGHQPTITLARGQLVSCSMCHKNPL